MRKLAPIFLLTLVLTACTTNTPSVPTTTSPAPSNSPISSPTAEPTQIPTSTPAVSKMPVEIKNTFTPKPSPSSAVKGDSTTNIQSGNSSTNISVNNNGQKVEVVNKNGKRYAKVNGQEVELDANGCYNQEANGSKTRICINNN